MALLSAQSTVAGFGFSNQPNLIALTSVSNSQGSLIEQPNLAALADVSNSQGSLIEQPNLVALAGISNIFQSSLIEQALIRAGVILSQGLSNPTQIYLIYPAFQLTTQSNYYNYSSPLTRLFGEGFSQNAQSFTINKSELLGLTLQANNTAESLLTGLLLRIKEYESNSFISTIVVSSWKTEFIKVNNNSVIRHILLVELYGKPLYQYVEVGILNTTITPNNIV